MVTSLSRAVLPQELVPRDRGERFLLKSKRYIVELIFRGEFDDSTKKRSFHIDDRNVPRVNK